MKFKFRYVFIVLAATLILAIAGFVVWAANRAWSGSAGFGGVGIGFTGHCNTRRFHRLPACRCPADNWFYFLPRWPCGLSLVCLAAARDCSAGLSGGSGSGSAEFDGFRHLMQPMRLFRSSRRLHIGLSVDTHLGERWLPVTCIQILAWRMV